MKKAYVFFLLMIMVSTLLIPAAAYAAPPAIDSHAEGAALIDVQSGRILYSKQGDKPMRIASLTKIMTAIVAIEHGKLSDIVKVSKNAAGKEGSSLYLRLGEEMSLQHMLYGLMLRSGNDAATAIAEHVGGSAEGFAYMMNEEAKLIGMDHSHFNNPSGLDDGEGHYASANDMAKLTAYALHNPVFQEIVKTKMKKVPNPNEKWDYTWYNKNKMLTLFEGSDGVKTGYTKLAKRCLVSSATRGGQQLAVVTLNDGDDWADHARLLNFGFQHYPLVSIMSKGDRIQNTNWAVGRTFAYPLLQEEQGKISKNMTSAATNTTSYRLGELGKIEIRLEGKEIGSVPLYDKNSPRLLTDDPSFFHFKQGEMIESHFISDFLRKIQYVAKSLFTLPIHS